MSIQENYITEIKDLVEENKKITHPLYQKIMSGKADKELLKNFVLHRYHIKSFWTRNISAIHSKTPDVESRIALAENIFEEETGQLTNSKRHLDLFFNFGEQFGLTKEELDGLELLEETKAVIEWNNKVCGPDHHLVEAVAALIIYMEGQPPVEFNGKTMNTAMKDLYNVNKDGMDYFTIHSSHENDVEDDHAEVGFNLLKKYANTSELREKSIKALKKSIEVRMNHFTAILETVRE
ncbi:TenA family transcriptional regulator [Shouchella patagoniensis]|uniref:TenA family transcriptional regulator n=1 Tax=Shouchella patagoniensis TaxID=228576 RepID=UPI000994F6AD|nr:iron-containing redox enzyme family protein [Shouchella patagoniensis]